MKSKLAVPPASVVVPVLLLTMIPCVSLSVLVMVRGEGMMFWYAVSVVVTVGVMVYWVFPSTTLSSTPVTVRVWVLFHVLGVKVRVDGDNLPSLVFTPGNPMVTFCVG